MAKLTKNKRYFLQRLVETFKIDQRLISAKTRETEFNKQVNNFLKENITTEMKSKLKELNKIKSKYDKIKKELDCLVGQIGIDPVKIDGKLCFQISYHTSKAISENIDDPKINWDRITSSILLKLEACDTEEEAKKVLKRITNISIEKLINLPKGNECTVMPDLDEYIHIREKVINDPIKYKKG